jgi:hypothetical protein
VKGPFGKANIDITMKNINIPPHPVRKFPRKSEFGSLEKARNVRNKTHPRRRVIVCGL